jgi:hypothetical protein
LHSAYQKKKKKQFMGLTQRFLPFQEAVTSKGLDSQTWENTSLDIPVQDPSASLLPRKNLSNEFTVLHTGACNGWHLANSEGPSRHLSCFPDANYFSFFILVLISLTITIL